MATRRGWAGIVLAATLAASGPAAASPFTAVLDEFWILEGAAGAPLVEIFRDAFDDGIAPPAGPDGAATWGVFGAGGIGAEAGGRLRLTPSLGDPVLITATFADLATSGLRTLATNPANPNFLGLADAFEVHGRYDLTGLPLVPGQSMGIVVTDRAPGLGNAGNNTYNLFMGIRPATGERLVVLRHNDHTTNTSTVVDAISIEALLPGADQIEFVFAKAAGADAVTARFALYDHDLANPLVASAGVAGGSVLTIYDGETYIRGQFEATDRQPIPAPATALLLAIGLAAIGASRRVRSRLSLAPPAPA